VVIMYSTDHVLDAMHWKLLNFSINPAVRLNMILLAVSVVFGVIYGFLNFHEIDLSLLGLPLSLISIYLIASKLKLPTLALKELLIAATVSISVFYPLLIESGITYKWEMLLFFLVVLHNVTVFGFFEKSKDDVLGNFTLFKNIKPEQAPSLAKSISLFLFLFIFLSQFGLSKAFSWAWVTSICYLLMIFVPKPFIHNRRYRLIADGLLILLAF
jgi:hypothetical protein